MADAGQLKNINTSLVRRALRGGGAKTKNDLAKETGLSFPTVGRTVDALVQTGEANAVGAGESTGGRCAQRYALNPAFRMLLCLRLEAHQIRYTVRDLAGAAVESGQAPCGGVLQTLDTLLMRVRARYPQLGGIALGIDGSVREGTVCECFGYSELRGVNLSAYLSDKAGVPAVAVRDMHIVASGHYARCAHKPRALVCVYLGAAGMGASLNIDGRPFEGAGSFAGELHYLPIKNNLEYAKTHFEGADMVAYYMQVIRAYAALVNPDRVVLYENSLLAGRAERVRRACAQTLPEQAMPEIEVSHDFEEDYEEGLLTCARELLEEHT